MQIQRLTSNSSNPVNYETKIEELKSQKEELIANQLQLAKIGVIGSRVFLFVGISLISANLLDLMDGPVFSYFATSYLATALFVIISFDAKIANYSMKIVNLNIEIAQYEKLLEKPSWISRIFYSIFCCC